ncbi:MAG: tRNA (N(6)-L-threonylcarbamoyladenosine(37)-C(2))-methylthiotransferase MtaB [Candidatus Melainabacteria bacterium GWF2_37_15]|nr:MAG: tRNA (N(6)-L-threonylcarbamoyladenosine(37)-C(2))-methylthiotransferase MtaB [Candidatus Melainabacteria bacterium GWF2_37_15]
MKKVAIHTLGCRSNQLESSIITDKFIEIGWQVVNFSETADIYIINTCTVTAKSDNTSRYFIRKAKNTNPEAKIIVTGCYAQIKAEEVASIEGVDLVLGNTEKINIIENINKEKILVSDIMKEEKFRDKTVFSASGRVRATIKIQDGCNFRCSYCIVPYARGKSRSNEPDKVLNQIKEIRDRGFQEVVLSGIHLGQWGLDLQPKASLAELLQEIEKIQTLKRYRLSSIDPMEFTDELINTLVNSEKFCRHLHISLQSGNNKILKAMKRRYTVEQYTDLINTLVEKIPLINIGSDIIVGFPEETNEDFEDTYQNLEKLPIGYIHVFSYSQRKGTPAASMLPQVPQEVKKQRNARLQKLVEAKKLDFRKKLIGHDFEIIVENTRDKKTGFLKGITDNFVSVLVDGSNKYKNKLVRVRINSLEDAAEILKP